MARKSRKASRREIEVVAGPEFGQAPTAFYARLSVENSGKDDNGSAIETQVDVCRDYLKDFPELKLMDTYIDNGYTGTVFSRPQFNRLMEDVRTGKIRAIVVRDLSRFGRNYIETGTYLEKIFPKLDVRFIAVKEQYDSSLLDGSNESLMIPLQNMINDLYSKDISRKVSAALKVQREQGTYTIHRMPYGYIWNEEKTNIVPRYPYASYVKQIFAWFLDGVSLYEIAERLNDANIPTGFMASEIRDDTKWVSTTVRFILRNPVYTGDKAFGRTVSAIYKGVKIQKVEPKNWFVKTDDHEAIIQRSDFEAVQKILDLNGKTFHKARTETAEKRAKLIDVLKGKVFCPDCGGKLHYIRKRSTKTTPYYGAYECARYRRTRYKECSHHYLSERNLHEKILEAIKLQVKAAADLEKIIEGLRGSRVAVDMKAKLNSEVQSLNLRLRGMADKRARLYEDLVEGILDETEYNYAKVTYDADYERLNRQLEEAVERKNRFIESLSMDNPWITLMKEVGEATELTQELVDAAIERVEVTEKKDIILTMKYHEIYEYAQRHIEEIRRKEAVMNE